MLNQFSRTELLLGHDNMEKLKNARVAVFCVFFNFPLDNIHRMMYMGEGYQFMLDVF